MTDEPNQTVVIPDASDKVFWGRIFDECFPTFDRKSHETFVTVDQILDLLEKVIACNFEFKTKVYLISDHSVVPENDHVVIAFDYIKKDMVDFCIQWAPGWVEPIAIADHADHFNIRDIQFSLTLEPTKKIIPVVESMIPGFTKHVDDFNSFVVKLIREFYKTGALEAWEKSSKKNSPKEVLKRKKKKMDNFKKKLSGLLTEPVINFPSEAFVHFMRSIPFEQYNVICKAMLRSQISREDLTVEVLDDAKKLVVVKNVTES